MTTRFIVYIDGTPTEHSTFQSAAEHWDRETHRGPRVAGGIVVQQFSGDVMMWLVHVHEDGVVYIHPRALTVTTS